MSSSSAQSIQEKTHSPVKKTERDGRPGSNTNLACHKIYAGLEKLPILVSCIIFDVKRDESDPLGQFVKLLCCFHMKYIVLLGNGIFSLTNKMEKEMPPQSRRFPENYQSFHYDTQKVRSYIYQSKKFACALAGQ